MTSDARRNEPTYRGSRKHKNWQPGGGTGTMCPTWTHVVGGRGFAGDVEIHDWPRTKAQALFDGAVVDGVDRWATERGIAFTAKMTNDGTWHGYPVPWDEVPVDVQERLIAAGRVARRDMRKWKSFDERDLRWALRSDDD
jgi:hypothetical protein